MDKTTISVIALFIVVGILLAFAAGVTIQERKPLVVQDISLGTVITIKAYGKGASLACQKVFEEIDIIDEVMDPLKENSDIYNLNANAGTSEILLDPRTFHVLLKSKYYSRLSDGAFDPTTGPLVWEWGISRGELNILTEERINELLTVVDYTKIYTNTDKGTAMLEGEGQGIDLGGIAKGYAGDEAKNIFFNYGIESAIINLGGNVVCIGYKPDGSDWKIGIQDPFEDTGIHVCTVETNNKALVTSGFNERYFIVGDIRYHHIIDPKTGYPADSGIASVTIESEISLEADALSTAVFVMGVEKGLELINSIDGVEAVIITTDKIIYATEEIKSRLSLDREDEGYSFAEEG